MQQGIEMIDQGVILAVIAVLPQLLLLALASALAYRYRLSLGQFLSTRTSSISGFGFRMDLKPAEVDAAVVHRLHGPGIAPDESHLGLSGKQVVARAERVVPTMAGRLILWVDDHPENNRVERRLLRQLGVFVESVTTNVEAMLVLGDELGHVSLVISDIKRDEGPSGLDLLAALRAKGGRPALIFYVGYLQRERGAPAGAFGITNRPDELLNLVMDALERLPGD